jgi:hypothetical protein
VAWDIERQRVTGLDAFGQMVLEDIWAELAEETAHALSEGEVSWQQASGAVAAFDGARRGGDRR